jgi:hypothetical protein
LIKMSSFIILAAKGEVKSSILPAIEPGAGAEAAIAKALKRAKAPELIGTWSWRPKLFLYGYKEGRAGTENKHDLIAPYDEVVLFGDAVIIASNDKSVEAGVTSFTPEQYKKFYNSKGGGDIADADEQSDDEELDEDNDDDDDDEELGQSEDEAGDDEEGLAEGLIDEGDEEELEDARPMLRIKSSAGFKKIAKWMHAPELVAEEYVL